MNTPDTPKDAYSTTESPFAQRESQFARSNVDGRLIRARHRLLELERENFALRNTRANSTSISPEESNLPEESEDEEAMSKDNDPGALATVAGGLIVGALAGFLLVGFANSAVIQSQLKAATTAITANPTNYGLGAAPTAAQIAYVATQQVTTTVVVLAVVEIVAAVLFYWVAYRAERKGAGALSTAALSGFGTGLLLAGIGTGIAQWLALGQAQSASTGGPPVGFGFLY